MDNELNYEQEISIDETSLDIECLDQAAMFIKYARHAAKCERARDKAKSKLKLTVSELDKKIRSNPSEYDIEKITDKVVENTIPLQEEYQDAEEELIEAQFELNDAKAAVDAFQDRKSMLEALVKLHGQQYFAGPNVARDLHKERIKLQEENKKSNALVASKFSRKNK